MIPKPIKRVTALCLGLLLVLPGAAEWPLVIDSLPGRDAAIARWCAPGQAACLCADELRLLDVAHVGQLLLENRLEVASPLQDFRANGGLAAVLLESGSLQLWELGEQTLLDARPAACLAQDGSTLLAAYADGFWKLDSSAPNPQWANLLASFHAPAELLAARSDTAWVLAGDTLRAFALGASATPLGRLGLMETPRTMAEGQGLLAASLGEAGLRLVDVSNPLAPSLESLWQPGFPVLDACWWRDGLWMLAAGDSGLAVADLSLPQAPRVLARWNTVARARALDLRGDSLLVAEGAQGVSLHILRMEAGNPHAEALSHHGTRLRALEFEHGQVDESLSWVLDEAQGFRRFRCEGWIDWPFEGHLQEEPGVGLPLPVDGGDWRNGLLAGCRYGAGLRYYMEEVDGFHLQGIHPTDPVKLLAWGPEDLIAYVTPEAFVAIKQANRSPWFLRHHGTIALQGQPLSVAWSPDARLWVGMADGRLCQVDVRNPAAPILEREYQLAGPVRDLSVNLDFDQRLVVAAGSLYLLSPDSNANQQWDLRNSLLFPGNSVSCVTSNWGYLFAGLDNPPRIVELTCSTGEFHDYGEFLSLPASPLALGRRMSDGSTWGVGWASLENGDLLLLAGWDEVGVKPAPPSRPVQVEISASPNPFNPQTRLSFHLTGPVPELTLRIHDLAGRLLQQHELGAQAGGAMEVELQARDWPSGLLLVTLEAGPWRGVGKVLLLK